MYKIGGEHVRGFEMAEIGPHTPPEGWVDCIY